MPPLRGWEFFLFIDLGLTPQATLDGRWVNCLAIVLGLTPQATLDGRWVDCLSPRKM